MASTAVSVEAKAEIMMTTVSGRCRFAGAQHLQPGDVPQAHVTQQQVVAVIVRRAIPPAAVFGTGHLVALALQHVLEQLAHAELVIHN